MSCESFEPLLPDFVAKQLPAAEQSRVEKHLAGCAECRALAQQLEQLDAQLARAIKPPRLSPTFQTKLRQRIQATPVLTPEEIAARKLQLQAEYEAGLRRLSLVSLPPRHLLQSFVYVLALALVGWLTWRFLPQITEAIVKSGLNLPGQELLPLVLVSLLFVVIGLLAAFPQRSLRLRPVVFGR